MDVVGAGGDPFGLVQGALQLLFRGAALALEALCLGTGRGLRRQLVRQADALVGLDRVDASGGKVFENGGQISVHVSSLPAPRPRTRPSQGRLRVQPGSDQR